MLLRRFRLISPKDGEPALARLTQGGGYLSCVSRASAGSPSSWGETNLKRRRTIGIHPDFFSRPCEVHIYPFLAFIHRNNAGITRNNRGIIFSYSQP